MVLKADLAGYWALRELSSSREVVSVHVHFVQHDDDFVLEVHDAHFVPLASWLGRRPVRFEPGDDAASVVIG